MALLAPTAALVLSTGAGPGVRLARGGCDPGRLAAGVAAGRQAAANVTLNTVDVTDRGAEGRVDQRRRSERVARSVIANAALPAGIYRTAPSAPERHAASTSTACYVAVRLAAAPPPVRGGRLTARRSE